MLVPCGLRVHQVPILHACVALERKARIREVDICIRNIRGVTGNSFMGLSHAPEPESGFRRVQQVANLIVPVEARHVEKRVQGSF